MGNIVLRSQSTSSAMSDIEIEDEDLLDDVDLFGDPQDQDDLINENHLVSILRSLINSGEIQIINNDQFYSTSLPKIKIRPNLEQLKKSEFYQNVKHACGFADNKSPTSKWSVLKMISSRQNGFSGNDGAFTQIEKCKINNLYIPNKMDRSILNCDSKVFCGRYSRDGNNFITASQDGKIRVFDARSTEYKQSHEVEAKNVSWSILDIDFSPDGERFVYSTWNDALFVSHLNNTSTDDIHCLFLRPDCQRFGVFTVAYSNCGKQILAGANDGCLYAYDMVSDKRILRVPVVQEKSDINAVGFLDESSQIFVSGIDDGVIKVWDRRCLDETNPEPAGILVGHYDGITYIDSRNDGRHIISNSKDQSIKLWDLRVFSPKEAEAKVKESSNSRNWDYRWDNVPKKFYNCKKLLEGDTSIMTYRGHRVQKSLIRAKFSPPATTGQRYIYTGCGTGRIVIYDSLTGKIAQAIESHKDMVRDVSWHPSRNEILSCSWDFYVNLNTFSTEEKKRKPKRNIRKQEDSDESSDEERGSPPLRRSRRIQLQRALSNAE